MEAHAGVPGVVAVPRGHEWRRRPVLSRLLRLAVFIVPLALSLGAAIVVSEHLPRIIDAGSAVLWIVVIVAVSLATLILLERAARRLLPLAALLDISLLFPDRAPARFAVARRSGRQSDLQASLREARSAGQLDEVSRMRTVMELVLALSVHDRATRGHSERVRVFTDMLAAELKIPESGRARLRWAAILHDIGKLEVPTSTLNKQGQPTEAEWVALHRHPEEGAQLVAPLMPWFAEWGSAVEQHHERFDGTGYPHGLRGEQISPAARVVALADCYEVMTAPRSYKRAMTVPAAREELIRVAGTQLDPQMVRAFLNISIGRLWRTVGFAAWLGQFPLMARLLPRLSGWATPGMATGMAVAVIALGGFAGGTGPGQPLVASAGGPAAVAPVPHHDTGRLPAGVPSALGAGLAALSPGAGAVPGAVAGLSTSAGAGAQGGGGGPARRHPPAIPAPLRASPAVCTTCTDAAPGCVSHCTGSNNPQCTSYCAGNRNTACGTYCYGNFDVACTQACWGNSDVSCVQDCHNVYYATAARSATGTVPVPSTH